MNKAVNFVSNIEPEKIKKALPGCVFLLTVVTLTVWLMWATISWMTDEQRLPLSKLIIQGELIHVSSHDVRDALLTLDSVGTFMTQDVDQLQAALLSSPWIAQVSVRKQWPDTVKIFVVEHSASAIWNDEALLTPSGDVFNAKVSDLLESKVALYGPEGSSQEVLAFWRQAQEQIAPLELEIESLALSERQAWQMTLSNGVRLKLGRDAREERLVRFIELYQRLDTVDRPIDYIDLRYDTGAAVGWKSDQNIAQESVNE